MIHVFLKYLNNLKLFLKVYLAEITSFFFVIGALSGMKICFYIFFQEVLHIASFKSPVISLPFLAFILRTPYDNDPLTI